EDGTGIIVSTIDKLRSALFNAENSTRHDTVLRLISNIGVVVIDEAHRAEAASYRRVLNALNVEFTSSAKSTIPVLGLTATPLRSQHEETLRLARRFYNQLLSPRNLPQDPADAVDVFRARGILSLPTHRVIPSGGRSIRLTKQQEQYLDEWKEL